jgi:hypothetical protein
MPPGCLISGIERFEREFAEVWHLSCDLLGELQAAQDHL